MLPSGPAAIPSGLLELVGIEYSVKAPPVVILPMLFPQASVNQMLPSVPAVIASPGGPPELVGIGYSVNVPPVVILPILFEPSSVNQRLPSGPAEIAPGPLAAVGIVNSEILGPAEASSLGA